MRRGGLPALLALPVLLAAGCGLPDPFYLSPPTVTTAGSLDYAFHLEFTDRSTEPDFRGYELYYKIYADSSAAAADLNLGGPSGTVDALLQNGFLAVCRGPSVPPAAPGGLPQDVSVETRAAPLILIDPDDRNDTFPIEILFNPGLGTDSSTSFSYTSPKWGPLQQEIDRHINGLSRCKPFTFVSGNYSALDADIKAIWPPPATVYVAMYAVSYGLQNLSTPIYSYPVSMGYLQLSTFVP